MKNQVLITGAAGFIGFHLTRSILKTSHDTTIIGFDNLNNYYDTNLKNARLDILNKHENFTFIKGDLSDKSTVDKLFSEHKPDVVVNLAAQAGVRYSITNPDAYINSNLVGFFNILEACRHNKTSHLVYASSSSVYGSNKKTPYSTEDKTDNPVSLYAATKKSNELLAYSYSKLYDIPMTGLRFFTVYGEYGRPDMAYYSFTEKMIKGETIQLFNHGDMLRDFTYIDDIIEGVVRVIGKPSPPDDNNVRHKVYNIGNNKPETLTYFVDTLERILTEENLISKPVKRELLPMQQGDVYQTFADVDDLKNDFGFKPNTPLETGLRKFVKWHKSYYKGEDVS